MESKMQQYSHRPRDSMSSALGPLCGNVFASPLSLRRLSTSSMATTVSCATNPNSPALHTPRSSHTPKSPHTPKSEGTSSPIDFGKGSFGDFMHGFDHEEAKYHHGNSIAPNLLSINSVPFHGYHSQEDLLQPDQIENIDQMYLHQPQPQYTQHSIVRYPDSITPFVDDSNSFASWNPREAAMTALECVTKEYEELDMSDEDSHHSSPSPALSYLPPSRQNRITSSPPTTRTHRRRAPRSAEIDRPLIVTSADMLCECPVNGCRRRFKRQEHLRRHERTHTSEKPYPCNVIGCGKNFSRTDNLRAHRRTHMKQGGRNHFVPGLEMQ